MSVEIFRDVVKPVLSGLGITLRRLRHKKVTGQSELARAWLIRVSADASNTLPPFWISEKTGVALSR